MLSAITRLFPVMGAAALRTRVLHSHHVHGHWSVGHHATDADYVRHGRASKN